MAYLLQRRNEECYGPVIQILKYLVNNNLQEGAGAVLNQQGGLPIAAAEEAKAGILRVKQAGKQKSMTSVTTTLIPLSSLAGACCM